MADRVYPFAKTATVPSTVGGNPSFPATKAQLYNHARPAYRPQPRRSCCCKCFLWTTLILIFIILFAAIAGCVLWVLYRPHRPSFSVSSLQISQFNISSSNTLSSKFNLTLIRSDFWKRRQGARGYGTGGERWADEEERGKIGRRVVGLMLMLGRFNIAGVLSNVAGVNNNSLKLLLRLVVLSFFTHRETICSFLSPPSSASRRRTKLEDLFHFIYMASFAIHSAGNATCIGKSQGCNDHHLSTNQLSVSISNCTVKARRWLQKVSASSMAVPTISVASSSSCGDNLSPFDKILTEEFNDDVESPRVSEKLDEWMRDSVGDIVKNLNQAPLLIQIYANNNGGSTEIKTERAVAANWPNVMWKKPSPDGIILVKELGEVEKSLDLGMESEEKEESGDGTKAWGVLIQGKGEERECGSACYLLKTSRVGGGGGGLGLFCTHFCLVKVKSFRDSALQQFTDSWLLQ